ncbi:MAG TPA: PH domain-containing protein [Micromonosporaceae bacterium]|nr:PH domain-containing protein [Micromonosporaceae bacterium]
MTGGAMTNAAEPVTRLHPLSPLLRSIRLLLFAIAAISWQGYADLGFTGWLVLVGLVLLGVGALSVVSWWFTGYHVVGRELRVYEGMLWRRTRTIPLERLQAVDVVRPALARLAGLAELRLEVVGAGKTEAPLAFLPIGDAVALRDRLLRLATRTPHVVAAAPGGTVGAAAGAAAEPPLRVLHTVDNRDVLLGQMLTPQVWSVPFGIVFVGLQFLSENRGWTLIGVASLLTAVVGVVQVPVRRVMQDWGFRMAVAPGGLRLRGGLLETLSQTVAPMRVQAIGVTWPLLWRPTRWVRAVIDVAGYGAQEGQSERQVTRLLPVGDVSTARRLVAEVLPGVDITALPLAPIPRRARWLAPLAQPILGAALADRVFATTDGRVTRQLVVVPYERIQSVRIVQGPLERRLGLASVHADTAGALRAVAAHRDLADARALAAALSERARAARAALAGTRAGPDHPAPDEAPAGSPAADSLAAEDPAPEGLAGDRATRGS